ncbi:MAG: alpha/beta fold hydrolase [Tahibacter sp.]
MARIELPDRGLWLEAESHGDANDPVVILVMGLGLQLVSWPAPLIEALVASRRRVIVFDNRDVGLSGTRVSADATSLNRALLSYLLHRSFVPPYTIADMAADTLALADALHVARFDLVGVSLGGMVAQTIAADEPGRVRSLTTIMSSAGPRASPWPTFTVLRKFLHRVPRDAPFDVQLDHFTDLLCSLGHLREPAEIEALRARLRISLKRAYNPAGTMRQLLAVLAAPDRSDSVAGIRCPTLIVHGADDPLVPLPAARRLAELIPHARLEILHNFGHYLPLAKMPVLADLILAQLAEAAD